MVASDGSAAICPRTSVGYDRDLGEAGYLFKLRDEPSRIPIPRLRVRVIPPPPIPPKPIDWPSMVAMFCERLDPGVALVAANGLGVSELSLDRLSMGQDDKDNLTFPMFDGRWSPIGIRVRGHDGKKWAVKGSRNGLFMPKKFRGEGPLLICEGPTDAAAMMDLGFDTIGRASCNTGAAFCVPIAKKRDVVIVADADGPGVDGAEKLAQSIWHEARTVKIVTPPYLKDAREWKRSGATRREVEVVIKATKVERLIP